MADKGWNLENPGSFEGMNSIITDAYVSNANWVGYYWTPTAIAIENELVPLDWGVDFSQAGWTDCVMGYRDAGELPSGCEETPRPGLLPTSQRRPPRLCVTPVRTTTYWLANCQWPSSVHWTPTWVPTRLPQLIPLRYS